MDESTRGEAKRKIYSMKMLISHESWVEKAQKIETKYAGVSYHFLLACFYVPLYNILLKKT